MTSGPSSSNRSAAAFDAVVVRLQRAVGPIRLPVSRPDDFVDHFNRVYKSLGIELEKLPEQPQPSETTVQGEPQKIPGNSEAAGDDVST